VLLTMTVDRGQHDLYTAAAEDPPQHSTPGFLAESNTQPDAQTRLHLALKTANMIRITARQDCKENGTAVRNQSAVSAQTRRALHLVLNSAANPPRDAPPQHPTPGFLAESNTQPGAQTRLHLALKRANLIRITARQDCKENGTAVRNQSAVSAPTRRALHLVPSSRTDPPREAPHQHPPPGFLAESNTQPGAQTRLHLALKRANLIRITARQD